MRILYIFLLAAIPLNGCAIHPRTEDFSREMLPDIIARIRCETKAAIESVFPNPHDPLRGTAIVYAFEFTMTENNDATSKGSIKIPVTLGALTIGWDGGLTKSRETLQKITVGNDFPRLLALARLSPGAMMWW